MKLNIKFHPLLFQASLAAGGVALMPFNYLQYGIDHGKGLITWAKIPWDTMTGAQYALYLPLIALMLAFTVLHFGLTGYFLWRLAKWVATRSVWRLHQRAPEEPERGHIRHRGVARHDGERLLGTARLLRSLGLGEPAGLDAAFLRVFGILWVTLLFLEVKALRTWFGKGVDRTQFNFIWLLDVFAFALVSLAGSGIVAISTNTSIQEIAAVATIITLVFGFLWLLYKLVYLISTHAKAAKLPDNPILPAFFLVIPIACLFGLAAYRVVNYLQPQLTVDLPDSTALVVGSYALTIVWGLTTLYLIRDYFLTYFRRSDFAPPQWGLV